MIKYNFSSESEKKRILAKLAKCHLEETNQKPIVNIEAIKSLFKNEN